MKGKSLSIAWTHHCRNLEIDHLQEIIVNQNFDNPKILEIGAGDGYMSEILSNAGYSITSIDPDPREPLKYNVQQMDACDLQIEDSCYDIVISSNVLEHIEDTPRAFSEMKRILKNTGIMIHSVPTVYCNLATMIVQPLAYIRDLFLLFSGKAKIKVNKNKSKLFKALSYTYKILFNYLNPLRFFIAKAHGVSKNRFWALYIWRRKYWAKIFRDNGLDIVSIEKVPYLYSMHKLCPFKMNKLRAALGKKFSSVDIYILKNSVIE